MPYRVLNAEMPQVIVNKVPDDWGKLSDAIVDKGFKSIGDLRQAITGNSGYFGPPKALKRDFTGEQFFPFIARTPASGGDPLRLEFLSEVGGFRVRFVEMED